MADKITIQFSEVTITSGKMKSIRIKIDGKDVYIPVDEAVYAYFEEQFLRKNPTPLQRKKFATITNVLRSAYIKGIEDAQKKK